MKNLPFRRAAAGTLAIVLALLVSACFLAPGRFTSALEVRKDRGFSFSYAGELYLLPLRQSSQQAVFTPQTCNETDSGAERACTGDEIAQQKADWETRQSKDKHEAAAAAGLFGGIDPADPGAAEEIAAKLRRQTGWRKVEYKGDGLFVVDFAITGKLGHDFTFPTIEGFPMANAFVQVSQRGDGTVRVDAPGFGPALGGLGAAGLMQAAAASDSSGKPGAEAMPTVDGTFTVRTDAAILANNTDEGPLADPRGKALAWKVSSRTTTAPTALLQLQR
ncbi:hypothetical protein [Novosphingobium album (ex Liu et al. 2023)]|uniref:Lipoprotein n=1 Tax=Novosphingobium album (ex Liu et al. 2023) TaxID=3031130 RepID=A0ABT5WPY6_9SPHN|nr:hypothetical protein [Novosphingobium album (ex Liu et al. 2023)]MDE8652084.1 hypothetical protein [Novosphingobium album (ex Liu et al. 2023)]